MQLILVHSIINMFILRWDIRFDQYYNMVSRVVFNSLTPGALVKKANFKPILTSAKSWLSQEDLDAVSLDSLVPGESQGIEHSTFNVKCSGLNVQKKNRKKAGIKWGLKEKSSSARFFFQP